jgi:ribonuclease P protein component
VSRDGSGTVAPTLNRRTGRPDASGIRESGWCWTWSASLRLPGGRRSLYPVETPSGQSSSARHDTQVVWLLVEGPTTSYPLRDATQRRRPGGLVVQEEHREAHLPAQQPPTRQASRLPSSDVHSGWACRPPVAAAQGPSQVVGLIWRIRDRRTFLELRRSGRRARCGVLTITFAPDPPDRGDPPRVAFSVARKVGPAVDRNQIRRRIRAAMRGLQAESPPMVPPGAYLISVRPEATTRTYDELRTDVEAALGKLSRDPRARSGAASS